MFSFAHSARSYVCLPRVLITFLCRFYLLSDHKVANYDIFVTIGHHYQWHTIKNYLTIHVCLPTWLFIFRKTVWNSASKVILVSAPWVCFNLTFTAVFKEIPVQQKALSIMLIIPKAWQKERLLMEIIDSNSVYLNLIINLWLIPDTDIKVQLFLYLAFWNA